MELSLRSDETFAQYIAVRGSGAAVEKVLRDRLVQENWGLVQKTARRFTDKCPLPFEDLCQIGYEGLSKAIARYDPSTGNRFSSLAVSYIKGAILHHLRDHGSIIKVPRKWREDSARFNRVENELTKTLGRSPTVSEIAARLNIPVQKVQMVRDAIANQSPISINEELDCEEVAAPLSEMQMEIALEKLWATCRAGLEHLAESDRYAIEQIYLFRSNRRLVARQLSLSARSLDQQLQSALNAIATGTVCKKKTKEEILEAIAAIEKSGAIAPSGAWIEKYKTWQVLSDGTCQEYVFCRVRAHTPIFQVGDRMVKRLHLAEYGSPAHQYWEDCIERRRQIVALKRMLR